MTSVLDGVNERLLVCTIAGDKPGENVPVVVTLSNVPTPFTYPLSVIFWEALLPAMWPLLINGLAILLGVEIVPKPVTLPPKSSVRPFAALSVPALAPE